MTKRILRFMSFVTALCVLMGALPLAVYAEDGEIYHSEETSVIQFSPETKLPIEISANINKFYGNGAEVDTTKYFYNQLTAAQKKIYDAVWAAGPVSEITVNFNEGELVAADFIAMLNIPMAETMMAVTALNEDNPLFFWLNGLSTGIKDYEKMSNGLYTITQMSVKITFDTDHFSDWNDVATKQTAVIEKVNTIKVNGISRHEKLKSIHDYLANNIVYDDTIKEPNIYDSYGALINGVCVCEGYAEALKLLCDREKIPCITVMGTGNGGAHKWNMVQMEDGEWYTVDPTWDDQTNYIFYSYFLIGSGTKAPFFSNSSNADSIVHIPTGKLFTSASTALVYPTLSTDTYGVGIMMYNVKDIHFDTSRGVVMVGKGITNYYTGFVDAARWNIETDFSTIRNGTGVTTSTLTVSDGETTKEYLVAMRGDVNKSNTVNADDYAVMTQICASTYKIEDNSAEFYAGDMNQDGAVDGFDVIAHELYTDGELTFE